MVAEFIQYDRLWIVVDRRTGKRVTSVSFFSQEQADKQIEAWIERDKKGKRQDIHDIIPFLQSKQV